jgi:Leucine-rich repeat (LRR) protein
MKKTLLISTLALTATAFAQNVNIPDANFKAYLVGNSAINTNSDTEIQVSEAQAFTGEITCNSLNISDITGIEAFVNLTELNLYYNNSLTSIDISQNTSLTSLHVYVNGLTSLDVSNNTALVELRCERNPIMSLDVSALVNLEMLTCGNNGLSSLDVSNNLNLDHLEFGSTPAYGNVNQITSLDVSANTLLTILHASQNSLTTLDLSNNSMLDYLNVSFNDLSNLNVSHLSNLQWLYCEGNNLSSLDLSNNLLLTKALFGRNPITGTYDFSGHTSLNGFTCNETLITELNLANGNNSNFTLMLASETPNLNCIEVDDSTWAANNWNAWNSLDSNDHYSEDCDGNGSSIGVLENGQEIQIYPNPFNDQLFISTPAVLEEVKLFDLNGELLINGRTNHMDMSNLSSGVYLVEVVTNSETIIQKLIKQ